VGCQSDTHNSLGLIEIMLPKIRYNEDNLYIMFAPAEKIGEIEDLFDTVTLNTKLNGKKFSREKKIIKKTEYSKTAFAEKVIKIKQKEINFDNFKSVFDRFKLIINEYSLKNA